jgi:hypothetical protein
LSPSVATAAIGEPSFIIRTIRERELTSQRKVASAAVTTAAFPAHLHPCLVRLAGCIIRTRTILEAILETVKRANAQNLVHRFDFAPHN